MDFGKFDFVILITMSIAVVSLSFTMPALGMTDAETAESDIPELSISSDRFDFAGDFPERPGTPASGELSIKHENGEADAVETSIGPGLLWLAPDDGEGDGTIEDPVMGVVITGTTIDDSDQYSFNDSTVGDTVELNTSVSRVEVTLDYVENRTEPNFEWGVTFQVMEEEEDSGWLDRVPIVGGIISGVGDLAGIVAWGMGILYWFTLTLFEILVNLMGMLFDSMVFGFSTVAWLTGTHGEVISSANSWASVFVAIPGIALFLELFKMTLLGIKLLPTT